MTINSGQARLNLEEEIVSIDSTEKKAPLPHPIPYQGSKRKLAGRILSLLNGHAVKNLYEPFSGSAAFTIASASREVAQHYFINDSLRPLAALWDMIIYQPDVLANQYSDIWSGHKRDPLDHFYIIRSQFNGDQDPAKLLYLLARCVKNAVRFNDKGEFNQSADKRRLGTQPARMRREIFGAHSMLSGRTTVSSVDYAELLAKATAEDIVYMDPPWQGTSGDKDTRYHQILDMDRLIEQIASLNCRQIPFLLSFDGRLGEKTYGVALPADLKLTKLEINAGRSSQATLAGRNDETVESLYVSERIAGNLDRIHLHPTISDAALLDNVA
ncbi:MAG: DNA adenine methylase [Alcaligenaceae bacterium]|nr:MAG: DNA adenine methylase [Alcaligenaceae bacterium]